MKEENKVVKQIITGNAVPKSVSLIELEKNYALLAEMVAGLIDRIRILEDEVDKLEKKVTSFVVGKGIKTKS
jgi:hypothetical protein